jgi:hypothetical protein
MRVASPLLKQLSLRLGRLSKLSLGALLGLLRLFGLLNCCEMTPKGFSLSPLALPSRYARLILKLRKETPPPHDTPLLVNSGYEDLVDRIVPQSAGNRRRHARVGLFDLLR